MIKVCTKSKSIAYSMADLECVEQAVEEIERVALEGSCNSDDAREILLSLTSICHSLGFKLVTQRHKKFAPELQGKSDAE